MSDDAVPVGRTPSSGLALVLGGGGAKGIAHIIVLEALDELGLRPERIAGTSIGAVVGACYAAGMSGRDLRAYATDMLRMRPEVLRRLIACRVGRFTDILRIGLTNPVLLDAERLLDAFLPAGLPNRFEDLAIPLTVVATDFHARQDIALAEGPLIPAIGGSIALPGLMRPVVHRGRVLVDGGTVNPLPVDKVQAPVVVAVDILEGAPRTNEIDDSVPEPWDAMFGSLTLMMQALSDIRITQMRPTVLVRPPVSGFRVLDFFRAPEIFAACDRTRDDVKRRIARALEATPATLLEGPGPS